MVRYHTRRGLPADSSASTWTVEHPITLRPGEIAGSVTDHISIQAPLSACVRLVNILGSRPCCRGDHHRYVKQQHHTFYDHDRTGPDPYCYTSSKLRLTSDNCHYMVW